MNTIQTKITHSFVGRCEPGEDLLAALTEFVQKKQISSASFQVIGAVKRAKLGIFEHGKYEYIEHEGALEIAAGLGNVSLKEDKPFIHCHLVLTDHKGTTLGGHLMEGCIVEPTAEVHLHVLEGSIHRRHNKDIGLWILDL
ncbi:MAG: PPC domain-containing DNA-binding protein [Pseudomonadota bacterium]